MDIDADVYIGTAGWTIPTQLKPQIFGAGTHLENYSKKFNCVEINSSFYKDHKYSSYDKWAMETPPDFRFSVKLNRYFTQEKRLSEGGARLEDTIKGISELKKKFGVLLVQLPPSLNFELTTVDRFLKELRKYYQGPIAWEPRHQSWASPPAIKLLAKYSVNKVLADPEPVMLSKSLRKKVENIRYYRLHGSPEIYKSRYSQDILNRLHQRILNPLSEAQQTWVIFDNTTYGYATENAIDLQNRFNLF
jgi:uncharacterized protein YecE (DUF72 family)